jgi:O-antigen ligase
VDIVPQKDHLRRFAGEVHRSKVLPQILLPMLFAVLVSGTIRVHSLAPMQTLAQTVGNLLAVAAVAFLLLLVQGRRLSINHVVAAILLALAASAAVSVLGSGSIGHSLLRLQLYLAVALLATAVYLTYRDELVLPLTAYFLAIALVHLPFLLAAILWIKDLEQPFWQHGVRVAHFQNVRQFAEFGFLAAVSGTALGLLSRRFLVPSFLLAACAVFGVIVTGSRGALLSWIVFVVLMCCFSQVRLRAALHGSLVLALSASLVGFLDRTGLLPSPNIFRRLATQNLGNFDSARLEIWGQSVKQILARPLFGSGPEGYWLSGCCDRGVLHAHNLVLQFLMDFGLIGCMIAALLAWQAVKGLGGLAGATRVVMATPENRLLACLVASFLAYSLIDQMLYHVLPLLHFALFAGLFAASIAHAHAGRGLSSTR